MNITSKNIFASPTLAAEPVSQAVPAAQVLAEAGAFKFWRIQKPNAAKLLKEVIFRWRGASAFVPGKPGKWVVWPRERWCDWTGLSRNQLDRALRQLVDTELIERERHRFAGSEVRTFLRPTVLALKHMGRPQDLQQFGSGGQKIPEKFAEQTGALTSEKATEKIGEKTDYTSLPSTPTPQKLYCPIAEGQLAEAGSLEGKGKAGEDDASFEGLLMKVKALKQKNDDSHFPEKVGPHQQYVQHPSKKFPEWQSYSLQVKVKLYLKYQSYVENWYKGQKGAAHSPADEWTDEDDKAFIASMQKLQPSG